MASGLVQQIRIEIADSQHKIDSLTGLLSAHRQKHQCETLYADGRIIDAAQVLLEIERTTGDDVKADTLIMDWLSGRFRHFR